MWHGAARVAVALTLMIVGLGCANPFEERRLKSEAEQRCRPVSRRAKPCDVIIDALHDGCIEEARFFSRETYGIDYSRKKYLTCIASRGRKVIRLASKTKPKPKTSIPAGGKNLEIAEPDNVPDVWGNRERLQPRAKPKPKPKRTPTKRKPANRAVPDVWNNERSP